MSLFTRGESNGARLTQPEGNVMDCMGLEVEDHWGDLSTEYQALWVGFLNIQDYLGLSEMNTF